MQPFLYCTPNIQRICCQLSHEVKQYSFFFLISTVGNLRLCYMWHCISYIFPSKSQIVKLIAHHYIQTLISYVTDNHTSLLCLWYPEKREVWKKYINWVQWNLLGWIKMIQYNNTHSSLWWNVEYMLSNLVGVFITIDLKLSAL